MVSGISSSSSSINELRQQMFSRIDTNEDGSIDKSEMTSFVGEDSSTLVDEIFSSLDTNQDDLISMLESDSGLAKMEQEMKGGGMSAPPPPPDQVFDTADADEDGVVTKEELTAVLGDAGGNIDELFSQVDADGDGVITKAEDEAFLESMNASASTGRPAPPPPPDQVFDTADADGDGYVTEDELSAVLGDAGGDISELFSRIDTDGDGLISEAEDEAFQESMTSTEKNGLADGGTGGIGGQDWRARMFETMQQGSGAAASSGFSTSFYA